jgi:hypothetical protein
MPARLAAESVKQRKHCPKTATTGAARKDPGNTRMGKARIEGRESSVDYQQKAVVAHRIVKIQINPAPIGQTVHTDSARTLSLDNGDAITLEHGSVHGVVPVEGDYLVSAGTTVEHGLSQHGVASERGHREHWRVVRKDVFEAQYEQRASVTEQAP